MNIPLEYKDEQYLITQIIVCRQVIWKVMVLSKEHDVKGHVELKYLQRLSQVLFTKTKEKDKSKSILFLAILMRYQLRFKSEIFKRNKEGLDDLDIDDLYNNLIMFDVISKVPLDHLQNLRMYGFYLSTEDTRNSNEVNTANGVFFFTALGHILRDKASSPSIILGMYGHQENKGTRMEIARVRRIWDKTVPMRPMMHCVLFRTML
ncbi:hypothetical protein Tco_1344189 [Tanacetum coccineum]